MSWKPPHPLRERAIAWRARRIDDPVARLRFLRRAACVSKPPLKPWLAQAGVRMMLILLGFLFVPPPTVSVGNAPIPFRPSFVPAAPETFPNVWLVEKRKDTEEYSNGLRIETRYETAGAARTYPVYGIDPGSTQPIGWGTKPVGLVFHSTESLQAPFEAGENRTLQRIGEGLLAFVERNASYNYVIDRFGRVWRVVKEDAAANHAGHSVWASNGRTYVNLNRSFLGVSVEAQTATETGDVSAHTATPAQTHAARILTEMLRSKYRISAGNCVTHAQVSVNPGNMGIGYHTDWASGFPFEEIGLSDNYRAPLAGLYTFGFGYDTTFFNLTGAPLRRGIAAGEGKLRADASAHGVPVADWKAALRRRYRQILAAQKTANGREDNDNERQH